MMRRIVACLLFVGLIAMTSTSATAQETEAATRQYAVAVGFQNQKLFDDAIDAVLDRRPVDGSLRDIDERLNGRAEVAIEENDRI